MFKLMKKTDSSNIRITVFKTEHQNKLRGCKNGKSSGTKAN